VNRKEKVEKITEKMRFFVLFRYLNTGISIKKWCFLVNSEKKKFENKRKNEIKKKEKK